MVYDMGFGMEALTSGDRATVIMCRQENQSHVE